MRSNIQTSHLNLRPAATDDEQYMRLALEEAAHAAELGEAPIGAVVVNSDGIVATAHNRREIDHDPTAHAELLALRTAAQSLGRWRLHDCTVYVTLEPCPMCAGLMQQARIKRCVYGTADPKAGALGSLYHLHDDNRLNHSFQVTAGILAGESSALLRNFFASLRKITTKDASSVR
ncbi:MAG: tRNA adenosine(34) deaminase TadA [Coriobacteriia bacterium]|nr:tRNA adenosine(34) deaminase TadA [Coriobacteriia bacterium]MCL2606818.1 tRNA adenosine(34) deaminase TadA [Coriobacteriia bacterium]